jgi:hypothetical protein
MKKRKKSSAAIFFFLFFTNVIYSCKNAKFEKSAVMQRTHKKKRKNRPSPIFFSFFRFRKSMPTATRSTWSTTCAKKLPFSTIFASIFVRFLQFFHVFCNFSAQISLLFGSPRGVGPRACGPRDVGPRVGVVHEVDGPRDVGP